jgi:hypothetical protein
MSWALQARPEPIAAPLRLQLSRSVSHSWSLGNHAGRNRTPGHGARGGPHPGRGRLLALLKARPDFGSAEGPST